MSVRGDALRLAIYLEPVINFVPLFAKGYVLGRV
jgi:hypothetical protein